jgi:site-specific DNA recombinase
MVPVKALVYSRVSTDAQERDGTSLDTQERACMEYAESQGMLVIEHIRDTASGFTLDRPGMEQIRHLLRQGAVDVVLSYAVDRLSRNQNHIGVLLDAAEQAGARLEFVTERFEDSAIGRFIVGARAFIGEVEREKIAERTMRGKAERARSGRIPQGMGKGTYGYLYDRQSGLRVVDELQATIVRHIFQRYTATQSFSKVSGELNEDGIPAFSGGRWYPLTIRRILGNESYSGHLIYRRTKRIKTRNGNGRTPKSRVVIRPEEDWIPVDGSTPEIVDRATWERVQRILQDPERIRHQPTPRIYPLRGRMRCGICASAMVGQTLTVKGKPYRYYRCRHVYDKNTKKTCSARYVQGERLEEAVWQEVKRVLSDPGIVIEELERAADLGVDETEVSRLQAVLSEVAEREKRLVHLFTLGDINEEAVRNEGVNLAGEKRVIEERLTSLSTARTPSPGRLNQMRLEHICKGIADWLDRAGESERELALVALQVTVKATKDEGTVSGVLPVDHPPFITNKQSCRCLYNGD